MIRLFQTNQIRKQVELEGIWEFAVLEPNKQLEDASYLYRLPVPGCWEMHPELLTYRGRGVYRRSIAVDEKKTLRFVFKGVSHTAKVYFDGRPVAEHYNAYTAFSAVVRDVEPGIHGLAVIVDNGFGEASSLHVPNDYYTYGGIIRPVVQEEISELFIERIQFTPVHANGAWQADIKVTVRNAAAEERSFSLNGELDGYAMALGEAAVHPGAAVTLSGTYGFEGVEPWSPQAPKLYELSVKLSATGSVIPLDDLIERVGFRTVATQDGKIIINGKPVVLKGFNRHEDHPMAGAALPLSLMVKDLDLMADMGCNAVRTSHYPNDERFLDLCDERGIFVWEENHARGLSIEQMRNPNFIKQCEDVNREMVEQHANHPAIIIWAILNECASHTEEGRVHYKRQLEQIRSMDTSRPLTFASHHRDKEMCFDLADIVSFNLYPGWYGNEEPGELCDLARGWADAAGGKGKPVIMSEFGGDGFYGYRSPTRVKGTEERQADIIDSNLAAYTSRDYVSGMFIWQFCDCRVTEEGQWPIWRAQTKNSKGIVDEYRRPKLAYAVVRKYFKR
ncbi:MAG: beta-galactosidase [Paenibacillus sp.]|jgi:beta-glucuronidase|nr:beta-galactosidase [Paenibacillus sp.]